MIAQCGLMTRTDRFIAILLLLITVVTTGCGRSGDVFFGPWEHDSFPMGHFKRPSASQAQRLGATSHVVVDSGMSAVVSIRTSLQAGAFEIVTSVKGAESSRRRVERIGENLTLLPIPPDASATLDVYQVENAGPLEVQFLHAEVASGSPEAAIRAASARAARFEAETGQLADPTVENLVPNASFAADDEVRGTPADWFAYVETSTDVQERRLRVSGIAPPRRPFLATGPIRVESDVRYRVIVRVIVRAGAVAIRVADYEDTRLVAEVGAAAVADGPVERRVDFLASEADRAARIRFEPVVPGEFVDFEVSVIQMERLP